MPPQTLESGGRGCSTRPAVHSSEASIISLATIANSGTRLLRSGFKPWEQTFDRGLRKNW